LAKGVIMLTLPRLLLVVFFALAPVQAFSGPAEDAGVIFAKWKAAYDSNDNVAVAKLYAEDAILHGTRSRTLTIGREAITNYFKIVVGTGNKVQFVEQQLKVISPTTILAVGFNDFLRNKDGTLTPEPARFTLLLVKQGDDWLIAHHHSSLRPPPPQ
jgi:uncharacterized protein (TIGR02246 family)